MGCRPPQGERPGQLRGKHAPATWNRNRAAVVSWLTWCATRKRWPAPQLPATPSAALSTSRTSTSSSAAHRSAPKGGDTEFVYPDTGTAHLLPRLLRLPDGTSRTSGPPFLASRRPVPACCPAARDICPHTGRARLGYDRARVPLKKHTATATGDGLELHQLRHSRRPTSATRRSRCS